MNDCFDEEAADNERTTATGLFNFADSYRAGALQLIQAPPRDMRFEDPIEFLTLHAIELYLKAFLRSEGVSVWRLRGRKLGHDISALCRECEALGLNFPGRIRGDVAGDVLHWFTGDSSAEFRYIRTGRTQRIVHPHSTELMEYVRDRVGECLRAKALAIT